MASLVVHLLGFALDLLELFLEIELLLLLDLLVRELRRHAREQAVPQREPDRRVRQPAVDLIKVVGVLVEERGDDPDDDEDAEVRAVLQRPVVGDVVALPGRHRLESLGVRLVVVRLLLDLRRRCLALRRHSHLLADCQLSRCADSCHARHVTAPRESD